MQVCAARRIADCSSMQPSAGACPPCLWSAGRTRRSFAGACKPGAATPRTRTGRSTSNQPPNGNRPPRRRAWCTKLSTPGQRTQSASRRYICAAGGWNRHPASAKTRLQFNCCAFLFSFSQGEPSMSRLLSLALLSLLVPGLVNRAQAQTPKLDLRKGDRIVFMGDTFAEREALYGYIETMLHAQFPEHKPTFRNLAYSAD